MVALFHLAGPFMTANPDMKNRIFRKTEHVVSREIAGETLLVPIRGKRADMQNGFAINPVARYIWDELDGTRTLDEIRDGILSRFDVAVGAADADLAEFIGKLLDARLIAAQDPP